MKFSHNNIAVFGVGAIGSLISCLLSGNGNNHLYYFNRSFKEGIELKMLDKEFKFNIKCEEVSRFNDPLDWIIVTLKEHQLLAAIDDILVLIRPETKLLVLRNGLDHKWPFVNFISTENILEAIIDCSVQPDEKGKLNQKSEAKLMIADSIYAKELTRLFDGADNIQIQIPQNFQKYLWLKLIESAAIGAISCINGSTISESQKGKYFDMYVALVQEAIEVAKAEGVFFENNIMNYFIDKFNNYPNGKGSSMLTDRLASREIELGAKSGAILKKAAHHHMICPMHLQVVQEIMSINSKL